MTGTASTNHSSAPRDEQGTNASSPGAPVLGLHHVSVMASRPQPNLDFWVGTMGMRLVKRSVNQDDPGTYHLFYGDGVGTPGSALTFFPWPHLAPGREGAGETTRVALAIPPGTQAWWLERLRNLDVPGLEVTESFGAQAIEFQGPDGLHAQLVEAPDARPFVPWPDGLEAEVQVRGLEAVRVRVRDGMATRAVLEGPLGLEVVAEDGPTTRLQVRGQRTGAVIDVVSDAEAPPARLGRGSVHHVAWRVPDMAALESVRADVAAAGLRPTPVIDRFWFRSVYFHEPGGVLFELATDGPGYDVDEARDALGESLILPPWLESRRPAIERALPAVQPPARPTGAASDTMRPSLISTMRSP